MSLARAALAGTNIGSTLTTYGSPATMLWLTLVRKRGIYVSTTMYMRMALLTTLIVLVTTTLAWWVVSPEIAQSRRFLRSPGIVR